MITHLLDTSALLAHYRKQSGWEKVHELFTASLVIPAISVITITELPIRLKELELPEAERQEVIEDYLNLTANVVDVTANVAALAVTIRFGCSERVPTVDCLIGACAKSVEATLVHRDRHLAIIPGTLLRQINLLVP